jgi:hypothetical protein
MMLYSYYSLHEVINLKEVLLSLESLKSNGKLKYQLEGDIVSIEDLDLDESEIIKIGEIFDKNDVFPYLERDTDDDDENPFGYFDDYDDFDNY